MDTSEARNKKHLLQELFRDRLVVFERETGLIVTGVQLDRAKVACVSGTQAESKLYRVLLQIQL